MSLMEFLRKAYSRARFELLDFMGKYGHFHHLSYCEMMCTCGAPVNKDIGHVLFDCQLYVHFRYLTSLSERSAHCDLDHRLSSFLLGSNVYIVNRTANFIVKTVQLRTHYTELIRISCKGDVFRNYI